MELAPVIVQDIENILLEIRAPGITTVIVEQNAVAALRLSDRAVILDTGEMAFVRIWRAIGAALWYRCRCGGHAKGSA